jgi:hypothetical protein
VPSPENGPDLERRIEQLIGQRTFGRVRQLRVARGQGRLIVKGCCPTYYVKQLAIVTALEVLAGDGSLGVEVDIQVTLGLPRPTTGQEDGSPGGAGPVA